ncbi:uncharacterized protein PGTG_21680 [Puccinia graminis f. sp. tritici CRL 75-36-700-3]|uniref:Uncharacterized protein n=1 Tax=Puccinia graminis f. sp. tritici (strain CRL 75-36-700-3 / race SCCL) TaxID=418459 RepID=H6QS70_PUCGT|nr:uncharacterized protein PGTG_21680 [Puccinia graminis f. sp. tritici CRL 75-36-700-3]EHS63504.1 hypothetical protein PGTG_21680 [Puccinia graminis f. sp. tritici CRL 75-36-700-3]
MTNYPGLFLGDEGFIDQGSHIRWGGKLSLGDEAVITQGYRALGDEGFITQGKMVMRASSPKACSLVDEAFIAQGTISLGDHGLITQDMFLVR